MRALNIKKKVDKNLFLTEETNTKPLKNAKDTTQTGGKSETKKTILNEFYLGTGAFISIENDSSKKIAQTIKPVKEEELSIINIEIKTKEEAFVVELLDNAFKVIKRFKNKTKVRFEDITPGEYQIRLIIDSNCNGRWDPGNYFMETEPEKIIYYRAADASTIIKGVKANWVVGEGGEMFITY